MRITDTEAGSRALEALDNLAQDATIHAPGDDPGREFMRALAAQLEIWFPWLGADDDEQVSGADVVDQINAIHADLLTDNTDEDEAQLSAGAGARTTITLKFSIGDYVLIKSNAINPTQWVAGRVAHYQTASDYDDGPRIFYRIATECRKSLTRVEEKNLLLLPASMVPAGLLSKKSSATSRQGATRR